MAAAVSLGIVMLGTFSMLAPVVGAEVTPIVSATLNGSTEGSLVPGQPGIFEIEFTHPDLWEDTLVPIRLEMAGGASWTNALKWSVQNSAGAEVVWPLAILPVPATSITLDRDTVGQLFLLLSPEASAAVPLDAYTIDFMLDTRSGAADGAWVGIAEAIQLEIQVQAEPTQLTPNEIARNQVVLAQYYALREDFAAAEATVDLLLATQPRNQEGLRAKAEILRLRGNLKDALGVADLAIGIFADDFPNAQEPPLDLFQLQNELKALSAAGLKVTSATIANGQLTIVWEAETGKQYRVESSADFRTWRADASGLSAANGTANWTGMIDAGMRFFRIVME